MDGRQQWKSQLGFLMAAVGSAIGLGNIWRFSYMAYSYGGGAFLIPYVTALLTAGIPLLVLEFAIGHERIGSAPVAYAKLGRRWEWLGWWAVIFVMFGIELYYTTVIAWCLNFLAFSFGLGWGEDTDAFFFKEFLGLSGGPFELGGVRAPILASLAVVWLINWIILYRGVQRGLELANKIMMPLLFVLTGVLVAWALTLDGAASGVRAYLIPDFSKLSDPRVWIDAYSQIFFTLSLGFGIMIAYASYLPEKTDITKNAVLTAVINCSYSLFAGFAVFSVLGFMAQSQGRPISEVVSQSIGLAFVAYPKAVSLMPGGNFFGAIFFLCLSVAGISSSISIFEAFTCALVDKFGFRRRTVVNVVGVAGFLGSVVFTTKAGLFWLDIADHFLTHYGLVVVGVAECVLVSWLFRLEVIREHVNRVSSIKLGPVWGLLVKYFVPLALGLILVLDLYKEVRAPYEGYPWKAIAAIGLDWVLLSFIAALWVSMRPWRTACLEGPCRSGEGEKMRLKQPR